jgi:hypothetical protein
MSLGLNLRAVLFAGLSESECQNQAMVPDTFAQCSRANAKVLANASTMFARASASLPLRLNLHINGGYFMLKKVLSIIASVIFIFLIFVFTLYAFDYFRALLYRDYSSSAKILASFIILIAIVAALSLIKMRYWLPSVPIYIIVSTFEIKPSNSIMLGIDALELLFTLFITVLFQVAVYLISTAVEGILASRLPFDKTKLITVRNSCFGNIEKEKFLCSLKSLFVAVLFQIALLICTHYIYEQIPSLSLLFVLLLGLSLAAIYNKIKIRNWILSMAFYVVLSESVRDFDIGSRMFFSDSLYDFLIIAELSIIFVFFIARYVINYRKAELASDTGLYAEPMEPVEPSREN